MGSCILICIYVLPFKVAGRFGSLEALHSTCVIWLTSPSDDIAAYKYINIHTIYMYIKDT